MEETILVHVSGLDRPGLTAALMGRVASAKARVVDIEQITIHHRLHLSVLIALPEGRDLLKELLFFGWEQGVTVDFEVVGGTSGPPPPPPAAPTSVRRAEAWAVTLLASELGASELHAAASAIVAARGNIERISCLANYPVRCYELVVRAEDPEALRANLVAVSREHRIDIAVQREGLSRRAIRLVALDVDSTLIQNEVVDLLGEVCGCGDAVAAITERAMAGELDFEAALRERVALLGGLELATIEAARERVRLTPGARTFVRTLKRLGFRIALVSGGFTVFTDALQAELGVDYAFANTLEVVDGRLTGKVVGPVVDRRRKAALLAEVAEAEGIALSQTVAVGDGANDLDMLAAAGLGIAFNAKPLVRDAADTAVSVPFLDAVLFVLGIRREDVDDADDAEGLEVLKPHVG